MPEDVYLALIQKLKHSPVQTLLGIIGPFAPSGGTSPGAAFWTLRFEFMNWKFVGAQLKNMPLKIEKDVTKEELGTVMKAYKAYDVIEIEARVADHPTNGQPYALLERVIHKITGDAELNREVSRLQTPVTFEDPLFGVFTLDRRMDQFEVETNWCDQPVTLSLDADGEGRLEKSLDVAKKLWADAVNWNGKVLDCAADHLLGVKNDSWLQEDELPLTREEFKSKIRPTTFTVYGGGELEFWFNDGDLFWGHAIRVDGSFERGPADAGIHG